ncbi:MAG: aminotransferase class IV [Actinobacteria bacterium]|nr:aminotransferase class IV [Actinomycetota bacterium]
MLYLNGAFMALDQGRVGVEDRGFQLGDGVYEVVKVVDGRLLWMEDHLDRLAWSLGEIRLYGALEGHPLHQILPRLVEMSGVVSGTAYVQVTRGVAPREFALPNDTPPTVLAYVRRDGFPGHREILDGIALHAVEDIRWARCDIKSTNLLAAVLAKHAARDAGAGEVLYVSPEGLVREGGSSNAFVFLDGVLRTHPANNRILNGITRQHVLELARGLDVRVDETAVSFDDLAHAEEIFIASTTRDVMPVVKVSASGRDDLIVNGGRPGPVTLSLADAMRAGIPAAIGAPPPVTLSRN